MVSGESSLPNDGPVRYFGFFAVLLTFVSFLDVSRTALTFMCSLEDP